MCFKWLIIPFANFPFGLELIDLALVVIYNINTNLQYYSFITYFFLLI